MMKVRELEVWIFKFLPLVVKEELYKRLADDERGCRESSPTGLFLLPNLCSLASDQTRLHTASFEEQNV